jgi:subtilisin family serine protease
MLRASLSGLAVGVLLSLHAGAGSASPGSARIVVGYTQQGYAHAAEVASSANAQVVARLPELRAEALLVPGGAETALAALRADPQVRYAELDGHVHALRVPNDPYLSTQWSVTKIRANQAWDLSTGSAQVVIGVLDTGVDPGQPDLQGKLVAGYDYVNNDQDASDDNGHGTSVAGVVAADSDNRIGVAGYCWACRLMPVKVLGADGTGFMSALAQGMIWATDHGARVLNLSLGGPVQDVTLAAAAQYAWQHGVLVVAAAGNESSLALDYPAALPNVLSVGASDRNDDLYAFSNAGARVAAPGENSTTGRGGTYVSFLGTSSAAPVVSGIAGLAFSLVPGATPAQVERALESTAAPVAGVVSGRVDAYAALQALAPGSATPAGGSAPGSDVQPDETAGGKTDAGAGVAKGRTKVMAGSLRPGRRKSIVVVTGAGLLQAKVRMRAGRPPVRLRLLATGRVVASARGRGATRLRARVGARTYRLLLSSSSRKPLRYTLTVAYPSR